MTQRSAKGGDPIENETTGAADGRGTQLVSI